MRTAVLGAGSWGTALAWALARAGRETALWCRRPEQAASIREAGCNLDYLPDTPLPPAILPIADLQEALAGARLVIVAIPSHGFRAVAREMRPHLSEEAVVVSAAKGIEVESLHRMSRILRDELEGSRIAVLSGPSFAKEVVEGNPTAVVAAAERAEDASFLQEALSGPLLRLYTHDDVIGVEMGGCFKNVIAIAAGAVEGLGYGTNTMAALITRGLREVCRLAVAEGGREETLSGLSGLGDLVLTCMGGLSRNKRVGERLAGGESLEEIHATSTQVAEGIRTTLSINRMAEEHGVEVPIAAMVREVLYEDRSPREAVVELMTREQKAEFS